MHLPNSLFDDIAPGYDLANLVLSGGVVAYWDYKFRRALLLSVKEKPSAAPLVLDLGCGTLRLARGLLRSKSNLRLLALDLSRPMLTTGLARRLPSASRRILPVQGAAESLPLPDNSLDMVVSQFVWRNLNSRPRALAEILRVLKPGGSLLVMEFGSGQRRIWGGLYNFYLSKILPRLGGLLSGRPGAYAYLAQSILEFPLPEAIAEEMRTVGFTQVACAPLTSGILFVHTARKP